MHRLFFIATAVIALLGTTSGVAVASSALAGSTTCTGTITSETIASNLVVPAGARCFLVNVEVDGNISVEADATLAFGIIAPYPQITNYVYGNVEGNQAASISLAFAFVDGNVTVDDSASVAIDRVFISQNARFDGNDFLFFHDVAVGKNLSCTNNGTVQLFFVSAGGHASGQCEQSLADSFPGEV
jgi:hypothetical protein